MIDKASNEYDICDTIGDYIKDNPEERFLIVKRENNADEVYRAIREDANIQIAYAPGTIPILANGANSAGPVISQGININFCKGQGIVQ